MRRSRWPPPSSQLRHRRAGRLAARLQYILVPITFDFGTALTAMVATHMGAGNPTRALRVAWLDAAIVAAITGGIGLTTAIAPALWMNVFMQDTAVREFGASYLRIVGAFYGLYGLGLALFFASQGAGPGISASCARLFVQQGLKVAVAARDTSKPVLKALAQDHGITVIACDASIPDSVAAMFSDVSRTLGVPRLVVHNIDGRPREVFRKSIIEVDPAAVLSTLTNSTFSAFLVGQQAAKAMLSLADRDGHKGTIVFSNASAALKGHPRSAAFAAACHGKAGLAQSMARELMPQGIHGAHVPIDAAIGWEQPDGSRAHRLVGAAVDDNLAHPDRIAEVYWQLHRQHRSTWAFEVVLCPWKGNG